MEKGGTSVSPFFLFDFSRQIDIMEHMSNAINIKGNAVTVPRLLKDDTLPWSSELLDLAKKAERKDSLGQCIYVFEQVQDAREFYTGLLTKPHAR